MSYENQGLDQKKGSDSVKTKNMKPKSTQKNLLQRKSEIFFFIKDRDIRFKDHC